jgi:4-hydroxybenzoate polyprenyltransferase
MQAMMMFALVLAGQNMHFGEWYYAGLMTAGLLFLYQQWLIRNREPAGCLRAFVNNQYVGMVIFIGILLQYIYAR